MHWKTFWHKVLTWNRLTLQTWLEGWSTTWSKRLGKRDWGGVSDWIVLTLAQSPRQSRLSRSRGSSARVVSLLRPHAPPFQFLMQGFLWRRSNLRLSPWIQRQTTKVRILVSDQFGSHSGMWSIFRQHSLALLTLTINVIWPIQFLSNQSIH